MDNQKRVREWMEKAGQPGPFIPMVPSLETRMLRAKMHIEETLELIRDGLGLEMVVVLDISATVDGVTSGTIKSYCFSEAGEPDIKETADALADIGVVNDGTAVACGIPLQKCFDAVMDNNDTKFIWAKADLLAAKEKGWSVTMLDYSLPIPHTDQFHAVVKDPSGKIMKPPTMQKVDLGKVIGV